MAAASSRLATWTKSLSASLRVLTWTAFSLLILHFMPFHQPMLSDLVRRLSPHQPEIGMTGTFFSTKPLGHPTLTGVLTGLALHDTLLVVSLLDGSGEVTIGWHHQNTDIGLGCTRNHVLDEVTMSGGIDDRVVVEIGEELLGGALDGHTTITLVLLRVHVEGEGEGSLTDALGLFLELLHLTLRDTPKLEEQTTGGGRLSRVDVAAD